MPQSVTDKALQSLTEWWSDMGVDVAEPMPGTRQAPGAARVTPPMAAPAAPTPAPTETTPSRRRPGRPRPLEDWIEDARRLSAAATDMASLKTAIEGFEGSPLKSLCEKTVVCDGVVGAPVMVIGEGPGAEEDRQGLPFVGPAGQLLDKMLGAIGLDRTTNVFITNVNYWRPPGNLNPDPDELAVCRPFLDRMVDLGAPKLILAMGGVAAKSLLDTRTGIMRLRGQEAVFQTPAGTTAPLIPLFHPAYLLRRPQDKSRSWRDLLLARARLDALGVAT
jgi:DNA polymerase